jgi:hypothetical protein
MGPKPSTFASMSWSPTPSMRRIPRTFVPTLIAVELPLTFRSFTTTTSSPSASTLPTASRTTRAASVGSSPAADHSCAHSGHTSSAPSS